ncbi:MAG: DUF3820 family protein [Balneolales bacterium]
MPEAKLTDKSLMPFGFYKGTKMANVPAGYLLTIQQAPWLDKWPVVRDYIEDNKDVLEHEINNYST